MTGALCPFSNSARHWEHSKRWLIITSSSPLVTHNGERVVRTGAVGDVELDVHGNLLPRRRASRLGTTPFSVWPNSTSQGCCKLRNSALRQARAKPTRETFAERPSRPGRLARDDVPFQGGELTICFAKTAYGLFGLEPGLCQCARGKKGHTRAQPSYNLRQLLPRSRLRKIPAGQISKAYPTPAHDRDTKKVGSEFASDLRFLG